MGSGTSAQISTHEDLFKSTIDTRNVMNILLEYMLKEVSVRDFLLLSNPNECKKYALFMSNSLYDQFYKLKLMPTKDQRGFLLFRKIDDLELSVRSQNCLKNENITYIGDLVTKTESKMLQTPNFGKKSLNELKEVLGAMNLKFGMEVPGNWPPKNLLELIQKYEHKL